jgi:DNA polymerase III delta prime subunit
MSNAHPKPDELEPDKRQSYKSDTDAEQIRKTFGIAPFWRIEEQLESYESALPNSLIHTKEGDRWGHAGGTNWLAVGDKGSGKTTLALWLAAQLMDENDETVVWRGAEARSEWLPYRPWTHLYLPAGCKIDAQWVHEDVTKRGEGEAAKLEEVVATVHYYDGLDDLLSRLDAHEFAVVYPDPQFRSCNRLMRQSSYVQEPIEYISEAEADDPHDVTPLIHWWVAFCVARLEGYGDLMDWTSLIFDEVADLFPQSARANQKQTYQKIEVMRKVMADSRKYRFSLYAFGHDEANVHEKLRRTFDWRVAMPDEQGNPSQNASGGPPVGFSRIPMHHNMLARKSVGHGICWTPNSFTRFSWSDVMDWQPDHDRRLKISLSEPAAHRRARMRESGGAPPGTGSTGDSEVSSDD